MTISKNRLFLVNFRRQTKVTASVNKKCLPPLTRQDFRMRLNYVTASSNKWSLSCKIICVVVRSVVQPTLLCLETIGKTL